METTNVIIVTEDTTTGAATIEVLPVSPETDTNIVTEIIEAILDPLDSDSVDLSATETDSVDLNATTTPTVYTLDGVSLAALNADGTIITETVVPTTTMSFDPSTGAATFGAVDATAGLAASPIAPLTTDTPSDAASTIVSPEATTEAEITAQAHTDTAIEAQQQADEAVARGDYEAAAYHREVAEDAAWAAGDNSSLHGSDATDLRNADWHQDQANEYEQQQAQYAQAGDYEAAKEAASNAANAHGWADYQGGGADHSGQARMEENQMDWAVWEEKNADYYADSANAYAAQGDFDNAEKYAAEAVEHQAAADYHGDLGEHGASGAVYDPSSEVTHDTSYNSTDYSSSYSSTYDSAASSYDSSSSYSE